MQRIALAGATVLILFALAIPTARAQQAPQPEQTPNLLIFTDYPSQVIGIGETVTLDMSLRTAASAGKVVNLEARNIPDGWTVDFRGDGRSVGAVFVQPDVAARVDLRVETPTSVSPGEYRFEVLARSQTAESRLPIALTVQEKAPPRLAFETDLPTLRNQPGATFRYNLTLRNEGDDDLTVNLAAEAPQGFFVTFQAGGQEVSSLPIAAGASESLTVEAEAQDTLAAGTYPLRVSARSDLVESTFDLTAEVVGRAQMALTAPDGRLSGQATIGADTPISLVLRNDGTAPLRSVELTGSAPSGWEVTMQPAAVAELAPGQEIQVTANVRPADRAVAGDYVLSFSARPAEGSAETVEYRVTATTSTLWGMVGVALIAVAVLAVGLAVARFGRR